MKVLLPSLPYHARRVLFLVLRQPLVVNSFITTILTQVSTSTVLFKVLHHLFEVFLCFHNSDFLEFGCKGKYLMCLNFRCNGDILIK